MGSSVQVELSRSGARDIDADVVVRGTLERGEGEVPFPKDLEPDDAAAGGLVRAAWARKEIRGKKGEVNLFPLPGGSRRLALVGLGPRASFGVDSVRVAGAHLAKSLQNRGARRVAVDVTALGPTPEGIAATAVAFAEGVLLASYEFSRYKSEPYRPPFETLLLGLGSERRRFATVQKELDRALTLVRATLWARDIGNIPADTASPQFLAETALSLGKECGLKVTVFDEGQLQEMGCGGILAVGSGSSTHPPRMIVLEHPGRPGKKGRTVAVVGKGITFDSGGISIKPAANMSHMKFDKSGAVAVLGIMKAAAELKVPQRVVGIMCCAENVPSGSSYRPGDIVRTYSGKTIEVLNTDAEGRVVLSDGLAYAIKNYEPDEVIDLATLTGACVVALGVDTGGLISTQDRLAQGLLSASSRTGEKIWRLPLTATHHEMVRSTVADVRNSTEMPPAGTLTAAAFLHTFVGDTPWAHLDIAGPAYVGGPGAMYHPPYHPSGYTGFGIRLVGRYLADGAGR